MVSKESVESQLIRLGFNYRSRINKAEVNELPHILLPDEEIFECVNGYYEGGFALLVATNVRVLLIDKKPLNFLTVEDLRFDMINQMDYSHRMMGAQISISVGTKNLKFRSYNQPRLRKLINHVQHCIAEIKKQQTNHQVGQNQHLEQINQQLQTYLLAQFQSQMEFNRRMQEAQAQGASVMPEPPVVKPSPELSDYLYSQSLLRENTSQRPAQQQPVQPAQPAPVRPSWQPMPPTADAQAAELIEEGRREVFGARSQYQLAPAPAADSAVTQAPPMPGQAPSATQRRSLEINPLSIAYSKLPLALRNRKFGSPSFHAHSHAVKQVA